MQTIVSVLQKQATQSPSASAYLFLANDENETACVSYGELDKKARAIAAFLQASNLAGERILLLYPSGLDFVAAFLGCLYADVIAVPMSISKLADFEKSFALVHTIAQDADIAGIFAPDGLMQNAEAIAEQLSATKKLLVINPAKLDPTLSNQYRVHDIKAKTIAYLQYTSGSTSTPKAAVITHKNLTHSLRHTTKSFGYTKNNVSLTWAPHSHVYGLVVGILVPLYHGSLAILMPIESFLQRPVSWLKAITKYKVTHSGCPNFGYDLCTQGIQASDLAAIDLNSWKVAINGGEAVQRKTLQKFTEKFAPYGFKLDRFCPAYGMSEVTGAIAVSPVKKDPVHFNLSPDGIKNNKAIEVANTEPHRSLVSSGKLLSGLSAAIVDPDSLLPVTEGQIGEVWLTGKSVVAGYWRRPEETAEVFNAKLPGSKQSYFRTGDLGFMQEDNLCLTGRLKEVLVIYGEKYYPLDLETTMGDALKAFSLTGARAAFSCQLDGKEQVIILQEIPADAAEPTQLKIIQTIRQAITQHFGLDIYAVCLVSEKTIPKTNSGKLQRKVCQKQFLENKLNIIKKHERSRASVPAQAIEHEAKTLQSSFIKLIAAILNIQEKEIDLNAPVSEYGFDSITLVKLSSLIKETYHVDITPANFFEYGTLADFFHAFFPGKSVPETTTVIATPPRTTTPDIAIIGLSCLFPGADNADSFWQNLAAEKDAITEIPAARWDWTQYTDDPLLQANQIRWGGFINHVAQFDAKFFNITPREAELTDPQQRLFLQEVWKATEDAGYNTETLAKIKTGLFVGVFNCDYAEILGNHAITDAYLATGISQSTLANRVSYQLNLRGPSEAINTACSSSLVAIHNAINALHQGDCDVAIAGGVNLLLSPTLYIAAAKAGMLSADGHCKVFDKTANGYIRSEGVAAVILKPLQNALADHDHIYAVIKGSAVNHGGYVNSLTVPNPNAQAELIVTAYERANIDIDSVTYIEAHGTGTSLGDPIEVNGLKKAFRELQIKQNKLHLPPAYCGIGSVKSNIGHTESAAGVAGVIKVVLAMQQGQLPASLHLTEINPYIDITNTPFYTVQKTSPWPRLETPAHEAIPRRAGVSSFGFGGTNAHVLLEEFITPAAPPENASSRPYLITLSAKTETALRQRLSDLLAWLQNQAVKPSLAAISYTLNVGRNHFNKRCVLIANSTDELEAILNQIVQGNAPDTFIINLDATHKETIAPIFREVFANLTAEITTGKLTAQQHQNKLLAIGNFYTQGYELDWETLHQGVKQRIRLPTYPFADDPYWVAATREQPIATKNTGQPPDLFQQIQDDLIQHVARIAKISPEQIHLSDSLSELGFDSITFKELAVRLENYYHIQVNPSIFFTYTSIQALSQFFCDTYAAQILQTRQTTVDKSPPLSIQPAARVESVTATAAEPIAIIGMQGMFPASRDVNAFWEHIKAGHDLVSEIPAQRWDWRDYYSAGKITPGKTNSKWGGLLPEVDTFDAAFFNISSREANLMDPQHRLFMEIVWKTIEDAGYDPLGLSQFRVGLFAGLEFNEYQMMLQSQQKLLQGYVFSGNSHAMLANRISYFLNFHGPSEVIDATCASSLVAVHRAITALRTGECEVAIAGGVSLMLSPETFIITSQLNVLSPDGHCKTFDKSANGYVKGEGVAAILLKPLSQALQDRDPIYAVIRGSAENHGGKAQSLTAPNVSAQKDLLLQAYHQAGISSDTVSYLETHGTGTELGDPIEIDALIQAFAALNTARIKRKNYCGLGSVKTNIGHLEPASGIASVIKILLALKHQELPGLLHFKELNPFINLTDSPFYVVDKQQSWQRLKDENGREIPRRVGISSFGVGGTNAHVVLEEFTAQSRASASEVRQPSFYLITLSAKQKESLTQKIIDLRDWLEQHIRETDLATLSYTLNRGRTHFDVRYACVVGSLNELLSVLRDLSAGAQPTFSHANSAACHKLLAIADLYTKNQPVDWNGLYPEQGYRRQAGLPSYPFIKKRYWFDEETKIAQSQTQTPSAEHKLPEPPAKAESPVKPQADMIPYLQQIFAAVLRLTPDQIDADTTYERYGVDSLLGLEIIEHLEKNFGSLPKTLLYEYNQLRDLAAYLQNKGEMQTEAVTAPAKAAVSNNQDVAIVGLSGIFPLANDMQEFWENLVAARDCITEIPAERWNYKDYPVNVGEKTKYFNQGGFIPDIDKFDPLFFNISPADAALMDPQERLFLQTAWSTLEDAGYTRENLAKTVKNNVGVFVGVTYNFYPLFIAAEWDRGNRLPLDIQLFSVANRVSYFLNLMGPSFIVDTACSSSLAAVHLAYESIVRGECAMAIAGGVNLSLHPTKYHMLGSYSFLSDQGRCMSFGAGGTGYVPGEGVGAILLKPLARALQDNDRIYGVIKASSMNHGGKTSGYSVPNPKAQADLIKNTLRSANIDPRTISYIEAHGTGTALGDPIEIRGLQEAFETYTKEKQFCAIGSVKSNIGHLESAAGLSQIAKVLLQLRHKKLVPTLHCQELNPFIHFAETPFYVQRELADWTTKNSLPRRAGISSFGAGGTNIHMIVEEHIPVTTPAQPFRPARFVYLLSAMTAERLTEYAKKTYAFLLSEQKQFVSAEQANAWLSNACYTTQIGRENMPMRLAAIAASFDDLLQQFKTYTETNTENPNHLLVSKAQQAQKFDNNAITGLIQQANFEQLALLWVNGAKIPWELLYSNQAMNKVFIPTYPFAKRTCWIGPKRETPAAPGLPIETRQNAVTQDSLRDWLYRIVWEPKAIPPAMQEQTDTGRWLIFSDNELGIRLQTEFGTDACSYCFAGDNNADLHYTNDVNYIKPDVLNDYCQVIAKIFAEHGANLKGIIYLWGLRSDRQNEQSTDLSTTSENAAASMQLLYLLQALIQQNQPRRLPFCLVSRSSQAVSAQEPIQIWQHHLWSLTRVFAAEQPNYPVLLLDLDTQKKLDDDAKRIVHEVSQFQASEQAVAYRDNQRYVSRLSYYLDANGAAAITPWQPPEAAIITGGLGGIGSEVCQWLASKGTRYLLLTGNTTLPARADWPNTQEATVREKIDSLTLLEKTGANVVYAAVDVTDKTKMQQVIATAERAWQKPIGGVFHLAGITTDSVTIDKLSGDLFQKVLAAKIQGSLILHDIFKNRQLNCFVLFSSIAALPYFGMSGLSAYAMANAFMDGFAAFRRQQGLPGISINWAAWADKGMSFRYNHSAFLDAIGMSTIAIPKGIEILDYILALQPNNIGVFHVTWSKFLQVNPEARKLPFFHHFTPQISHTAQKSTVTTQLTQAQIIDLLGDILASLLGLAITEIDFDAPYQNYGLDSIIGINFVGKIGAHFPDVVSPMDLYRYPNVKQLAHYIFQSCQAPTEALVTADTDSAAYLSEISQLSHEEVSKMIDETLNELNKLK